MKIFTSNIEIRNAINDLKKSGKSIGFVPTMGALHVGHLKLLKASIQANDITVCSIFVNPIQFNSPVDLEKYPRVLDEDSQLLQSIACDILFAPSVEEMYPFGMPELTINFGYLNTILEGQFRNGHFSGVGIVVSKLFNIIQPDNAYFGQKDFQQCLVVKQMIREFSFPINIKIIETEREADSLAISSRNKRLTIVERQIAPIIYQTLQWAAGQLFILILSEIKIKVAQTINNAGLKLEYVDLVDSNSGKLADAIHPNQQYAICIAAILGEVRLIDNLIVNT